MSRKHMRIDRLAWVAVGLVAVGKGVADTPPEVQQTPLWTARELTDALQSCLDNTFPDGPLQAAAVSDHNLSLNRYLGLLEAAKNLGAAKNRASPTPTVADAVRSRVEKMCEYTMYSTMPNGQLPRWGDSSPPTEGAELLRRGADYFRREDMRWVATRGRAGKRPTKSSVAFWEAGYFLMRSGWEPTASFLAVHNGRSAAHGHFDANSCVLTAFGNELLIDPGIGLNGTPEAQLLTRSMAHNTVTMDDKDTRNGAGTSRFLAGALLDVYDGINAGYAGERDASPARHRRRIVFVKPSLFLLVDDATAEESHDWALRFHFAPGELAYRPNAHQLTFAVAANAPREATGRAPDPNVADVARGAGGLHLWSADARKPGMERMGAAASRDMLLQTPVARWTVAQAKTAHFATLLMPFGEQGISDRWIVTQNGAGATAAYGPTDSPMTTLILVKGSAGEGSEQEAKSSAALGVETDAEVALLQSGLPDERAPDGRRSGLLVTLAVTNATWLTWQGDPHLLENRPRNRPLGDRPLGDRPREGAAQPLFRAARPVTQLQAVWRGDTLYVTVEGGADVRIWPGMARWLVVNGRPRTALVPGGDMIAVAP